MYVPFNLQSLYKLSKLSVSMPEKFCGEALFKAGFMCVYRDTLRGRYYRL